MKTRKNNRKILIQFDNITEEDVYDLLYKFEQDINENKKEKYCLKESENPFIYFLEYPKPEEIIKEFEDNKKIMLIPVTCVISNANYITSTILRKIRHKIKYKDTFDVKCQINSYSIISSQKEVEDEIKEKIKLITHMENDIEKPIWNISIYIIGDITAINITKKRNR